MANVLQRLVNLGRLFNPNQEYQAGIQLAERKKDEQQRFQHFARLYDYYIGDEYSILHHMQVAMRRTFKAETIRRMQLPYYNIVRRIIDRLCLAYKQSPDRYTLVTKETINDKLVPVVLEEKDHENYQELLNKSNINVQAKVWHKLARLGDTVLVHPIWRKDHIEYDVFFPHQASVTEREDTYLEPLSVLYDMQVTIDGEPTFRRVYWDEQSHYMLDSQDKPIINEENPNNANPYKVLPFVPLRLRPTDSFWGEGDTQLVDACEKINILLANTMHNAVMQSHGQLVAINTGLKGDIAVGPDTVIQAEQGTDQAPDIKYINPAPSTDKSMAFIDWMIKTTAMMHGLSANSLSIDVKAESGAAKAIDNFELLEIREDDIEILREFEKRLFDLSRIIWNYHVPSDKQIRGVAVFGIDFPEPDIQLTPMEEMQIKAIKLNLGLWTPDDDVIDEDEGLDREKAQQLVREKLAFRNELNDQYGILESIKQLGASNASPKTIGGALADEAGAAANGKPFNPGG